MTGVAGDNLQQQQQHDLQSSGRQMETTELSQSGGGAGRGQGRSPSQPRQPSAASTLAPSSTSEPQSTKQPSNGLSPSANNSPQTSRNTSPIRRDSRPQTLTQAISTQPSAASIQRALSAANVPQLPASGSTATAGGGPVTDAVSRLPRASKSAGGGSGDSTPQWPVSPRLKSPPPSASNSRRSSAVAQQAQPQLPKKVEPAGSTIVPSINVQASTPQQVSTPPPPPKQSSGGASEEAKRQEQTLQALPKAPSRGPSGKSTLETVQENSSDSISEPPAAVQAAADLKPLTRISEEDQPVSRKEGLEADKQAQPGESGSESAGSRADLKRGRRQSLTQPKPASRSSTTTAGKSSYTPLHSAKSRQNEGKQNMTVETETVQSIPQSALNAGDRSGSGRNEMGSLRLKPSTETIRPKKERKKPSQKARSLNQGTGKFSVVVGSPARPRSRLLVNRDSFEEVEEEDDGYDSAVVSSSTFSTDDTLAGSCAQDTPGDRRRASWAASPLRGLVSFGRSHASYIRTSLSNRPFLRKASSKADIFEARVARDVEEAQYTSDSDETFVYESNPPEPQRRPRHHSRTPSVTSSHSVAEHQPRSGGLRGYGGIGGGAGGGGESEEGRRVAGKRSMKFSSNPYNDVDSPDSAKNGTVRSAHQARHIGRFGRGGSQQTASSMFENHPQGDSPFTQASKLRSHHMTPRHSRPSSPRSPQSLLQSPHLQPHGRGPSSLFGGRKHEHSFDFDGEGADDERTPLVGTVRTPRNSARALHRRIHSGSVRSIDEFYASGPRYRCGRLGGCLLGFCLVVAVVLSAVAFLIMSNRPMYDVRVRRIQNVLASEQEIMLDLLVGAVNPNALGITVDEMDVNVFAKSRHVGSSLDEEEGEAQGGGVLSKSISLPLDRRRMDVRRRGGDDEMPAVAHDDDPNPWQDLTGHWHAPSSPSSSSPHDGDVDDGTDPMPPSDPDDDGDDEDLERDAQTMLLGRIFHFDQALAFAGSPLKRHEHSSLGEVRLLHPGNKTEANGSRRWEKVVRHPFELIVRGVLRYSLPVSGRVESVSVTASVIVYPEEGVDRMGRMRIGPVLRRKGWRWIGWPGQDDPYVEDKEGMEEGGEKGKVVEVTRSRRKGR
ncbi:hypothetical protein B0A50_05199 [Salinomyces thailandicus]|uniref:Uncharacterized protein n=1 Tax=Salinomyces thailandicus TaxID=706561 RepID=A0A4U0TX81_9PEZI|nr:hypothetical protein B0A50_05199 [Salinomyces thailandica]